MLKSMILVLLTSLTSQGVWASPISTELFDKLTTAGFQPLAAQTNHGQLSLMTDRGQVNCVPDDSTKGYYLDCYSGREVVATYSLSPGEQMDIGLGKKKIRWVNLPGFRAQASGLKTPSSHRLLIQSVHFEEPSAACVQPGHYCNSSGSSCTCCVSKLKVPSGAPCKM